MYEVRADRRRAGNDRALQHYASALDTARDQFYAPEALEGQEQDR